MNSLYILVSFFSELFNVLIDCLYQNDVISEDTCLVWEKSDDPAEREGKAVAINSTTKFFTWLKENFEDM